MELKKHKTPGLHGMPGASRYLGSGTEVLAVVYAGAQPRWLGKLLAATAGRSGHFAAAGVVAAAIVVVAAGLAAAALFAAAFLGLPAAALFAAALLVATATAIAAVIVAAAAGGLGFAGRGHGGAGGGGASRGGAARGGLRAAVATVVAAAIAVVAAAFPMATLLAATLLVAATLTVAAGGARIVATAGRSGVAAARASAAEHAGSVDGGGDTQKTGSQGRHDDAIHCNTPKSRTHGDGNGNNLSPEPPAPRCSRRCGRPRR
jgi:hypothetical protein